MDKPVGEGQISDARSSIVDEHGDTFKQSNLGRMCDEFTTVATTDTVRA